MSLFGGGEDIAKHVFTVCLHTLAEDLCDFLEREDVCDQKFSCWENSKDLENLKRNS